MLRNRMFLVGVGWGGVGMMTFLALAHMFDATQQDVSLGLAHMFDAMQQNVSLGLAHMFDATQQDVSHVSLGLAHMFDATQQARMFLSDLHTCLMLPPGK